MLNFVRIALHVHNSSLSLSLSLSLCCAILILGEQAGDCIELPIGETPKKHYMYTIKLHYMCTQVEGTLLRLGLKHVQHLSTTCAQVSETRPRPELSNVQHLPTTF